MVIPKTKEGHPLLKLSKVQRHELGIFVREHKGRFIICKLPDATKTRNKQALKSRMRFVFRTAAQFARYAVEDEKLTAVYENSRKPGETIYRCAFRNFLRND